MRSRRQLSSWKEIAKHLWRWPWIGVAGCLLLAAVYAFWARGHLSWILVISGPLLVIAGLFYWSWRVVRS